MITFLYICRYAPFLNVFNLIAAPRSRSQQIQTVFKMALESRNRSKLQNCPKIDFRSIFILWSPKTAIVRNRNRRKEKKKLETNRRIEKNRSKQKKEKVRNKQKELRERERGICKMRDRETEPSVTTLGEFLPIELLLNFEQFFKNYKTSPNVWGYFFSTV
jgi:hypothetical protein